MIKNEGFNVLSYLFKKVIIELNIDNIGWHRLIDRYVDDVRCLKIEGMKLSSEDREIRRRASLKSNINKALKDPHMSYESFIKGMRLLQPTYCVFRMSLDFPDDHVIKSFAGRSIHTSINIDIFEEGVVYGERLAGMRDDVLLALDVNKETLGDLITYFLDDPFNGISTDKKLRSSAASNMNRSLKSKSLTWSNIMRCFHLLRPEMITTRIDLEWKCPRRSTIHVVESKPNFLRK